MRPGLTRRQRTLLLSVSAASYILSSGLFAQALLARESGTPVAPSWSRLRSPQSPPVASAIRRDPFAGKPLETAPFGLPRAARVPDIGNLPPDGPSPATGAIDTFELKATIAGEHPVAYVQNGSTVDIVRVGSKLGGRTIKRIGLHGLVFSDDTSLELSAHAASVAPPAASVNAAGSKLDELRRLISNALRGRPSNAVAPPALRETPPAPPPAFATLPPPGPLPTIVPDFLPVGVSPTAEPNGPTPYPLPPLRRPY